MGTRRRKRVAHRSRKKKGGVWTPNQYKSVSRRKNLLRYTSKSKEKTNQAIQAIHNYVEAAQHAENSDSDITDGDIVRVIRPDSKRQKGAYSDYIYHVKLSWNELVNAKMRDMMVKKKDMNRLHHASNQAVIEANRAAMLVQQAAHIASIGRLSNSSHARIASELQAWNTSSDPVHKEDPPNMIQTKANELRLRYEIKQQLLHQILDQTKRFDQIIPLYEFYDYNTPVDKQRKDDIIKIVEQSRAVILLKIPELKNVTYNKDHVIPDIREDIYDVLIETLEEYIVEAEKIKSLPTLEILTIQLKIYNLKKEQILLAQQHFKILREMSEAIRVVLSRRPLLDMTIYRRIVEKIKDTELRIETEKLQRK